MNLSNEQNVFSDIPGFEASKGERIVKALQKLWKKIERLEQVRISERKSRSEISSSSKEEDLTITDVQYKLLVLQLQYARSILRKKFHKHQEKFHARLNEDQQDLPSSDIHDSRKDEHENFKSKPVSQGTNLENSSVDDFNSVKGCDILKNPTKAFSQASSDTHVLKSKHSSENQATVTSKVFPSTSKPHYHLKLDDVPFLLGASSTASHSVVANVQNIIAMMKSHNKALCGPKHPVIKSAAGNLNPVSSAAVYPKEDSQDATKMLNELSKDLYELALKQQKLVKSIDAAQGKNELRSLIKNSQRDKKVIKTSDKYAENHASRRHRPNSESDIKLHAEVNNLPKVKVRNFVRCNAPQQQNVSSIRSQPSNLSIMDRRKLLRSLQNFKTHLSEEDISWD